MPGAFARKHPGPPRSDRAQEAHPTLRVFELYRAGALVPGTATRIEGIAAQNPGPLTLAAAGKVIVDGAPIAVRPHPVAVVTFGCPVCDADRYKLYFKNGLWACAACHGLDRSSRHRHRSIRGLYKLAQLRRRIGADPTPFTPIAPKRINARNFWRDVIEIRRIEASLAGIAADNAQVLESRHDRRSRRQGP
jgi:hypothetical protein